MALDLKNEYRYLSNLILEGSAGERAWAEKQMDTYNKQYGSEWTKASTAVRDAGKRPGGGLNVNAASGYGYDPLIEPSGVGRIQDAPYGYTGELPYRYGLSSSDTKKTVSDPIVVMPASDPYSDMLEFIKAEQEKLKKAQSMKAQPFAHPDLINDDLNGNEEIL
jgi:hypothetical protein